MIRPPTLRVLLVSHTYFPSEYRGKLRELASTGNIELSLAAIRTMAISTGRFEFEHSNKDSYPISFLPSIFTSRNNIRLYSPPHIIGLLRKAAPDLVHVEAEPHSLSLFQFAFLRKVFGYRLSLFSWENIFRPTRRSLRPIESFNLSSISGALVGNREAVKVIRKRGFGGPVRVVPQVGITTERWDSAIEASEWSHLKKQGPVVGYIGRLVEEKGVDDLLASFALVARELNARLLLVGDGDARIRLEQRAKDLTVGDRVFFAGPVSFEQMPSIARVFDVMVVPSKTTSRWKEQFGHVIVEAMAAGVPVIGSDSGAIPEVISDAGLIFHEGDRDTLAAELKLLIKDPSMRLELSRRGRERVASQYSDVVVAKLTETALQAIAR